MSRDRVWTWVLRMLVAAMTVGLSMPVLAGPGRPDPRQMSGMPRPDPQIPAGEITVRVLLGSFDAPALGAQVQLELRSADGRIAELRTVEAGNQGRAHFRELAPFQGGQAVARVTVDGETIRSQQIDVRPDVGTAVMLVKGAPRRGAVMDISLPGIVFEFDKTPPGSLMVGVFDLKTKEGLVGVDVNLHVTTADGQTTTQTLKSASVGQVTFEGLDELPPDAVLQVEAQLDEEGEPHRSMKFSPAGGKGQAIVLARGRMASAGRSPHGDGPPPEAGPRRLQPLPPPQIAPEMPLGTVQVRLVDGTDSPVADQLVTIVKKDFAGTEQRFELKTDERGVATRAKLPVVTDALYYVGVRYDDAPYTSAFFGLDKRGGVTVPMRVWPVTADPSVARSAIQFEIIEGENDVAQVIQVYEVLVGGDKAFWPGEQPLEIRGLEGAKGMVVLRGAEEWLDHEEVAPFATLAGPIPPGEVAGLSIGYIVDHSGEVVIDWTPPFELIESAVIFSDALSLDASGAKKAERELQERPGLDYTRVAYDLGQTGTGPVRATVSGLRETDKRYGYVGMVVAALMGLVVLVGIARAPRGDTRARLVRRRDQLLVAIERSRDDRQRRRMVAALDRIYRQLDALDKIPDRSAEARAERAAG